MTHFSIRVFSQWLVDEEGQDLVEYGLLAFLISTAVVGILPLLRNSILNYYAWIVAQLP